MPSTSAKQHHLMTAVAHDPAFARRVGIPVSVGKDFTAADQGGPYDAGNYQHPKKAKPRGKWHNQHSGHPKGA